MDCVCIEIDLHDCNSLYCMSSICALCESAHWSFWKSIPSCFSKRFYWAAIAVCHPSFLLERSGQPFGYDFRFCVSLVQQKYLCDYDRFVHLFNFRKLCFEYSGIRSIPTGCMLWADFGCCKSGDFTFFRGRPSIAERCDLSDRIFAISKKCCRVSLGVFYAFAT